MLPGISGLVDDPRFYLQHPGDWQAAQRAARADHEAELEQQQQGNSVSSTHRPFSIPAHSSKRPPSPSFPSPPLKTPRQRSLPPAPEPAPSPKFKQNYLGADIPRPLNSRHDAAGWPVCPPGMDRPRYTAEDFQSRAASPQQIQIFCPKHPALGKRNFFIVQEHHATSKHWDLRLQLDGGTVSWVIPRGLFSASRAAPILGIETDAHPISYTLHEGSGVGTTKLEDVGLYEVLPTFSKQAREKEARDRGRKMGIFAEETTDEEEDAQPEDEKQEDLFAQGYYHARFERTPSRWDAGPTSTPPTSIDEEEHRGFVIKLNGKRYKSLVLRFHRREKDVKMIKPRDDPKATFANVLRRSWFVTLDKRDKALPDDSARERLKQNISSSILTGRTMAEIKADRDEENDLRRLANWQRREGRWVPGGSDDEWVSDFEIEGET